MRHSPRKSNQRHFILFTALPLTALIVISAAVLQWKSSPALPFTVEKRVVQNAFEDISRQYELNIEPDTLRVLPHAFVMQDGSDIRVTVLRKGNSITIVEKEIHGETISSLAQLVEVAETIDISSLPPGLYTVAVETHLYKGSTGKYDISRKLVKDVNLEGSPKN